MTLKPTNTSAKPLYSAHSSALIGGAISTVCYIYMAVNSQSYGDLGLHPFLLCSLLCGLISILVWWHHSSKGEQVNIWTLLGFAVLFRAIGIFTFPILEDDFYRYLWDARMTMESGSPYGKPPSSYFDTELDDKFELVLGAINYPDISTVYGPMGQWCFALAYLISPGEVWPLQLIFGGADIVLIFLLLKLAKPTTVLLYAWSPLIIKEFAITAHPDVLGALFLLAALMSTQRRHYVWGGIFLAFSAGVKVFALLLLPFLIAKHWRAWCSFLVVATLIALPFGLREAWIPAGLAAMGADWLFNAPLYALLSNFFSIMTTKTILLVSLALFCSIYLLSTSLRSTANEAREMKFRADLLFAGLFLCMPAFNPWYLVWLLPFSVLTPRPWAWVASLSLLLSYACGINLPQAGLEPYQHPTWVLVIEFGLIALAILIPTILGSKKRFI